MSAEDILAAGEVDHLGQPVPGAERRLDPLREEHPASRQASHQGRGLLDLVEHLLGQLVATGRGAQPPSEDAHRLCDVAQRSRVEREHVRTDRADRRELAARDGADRA